MLKTPFQRIACIVLACIACLFYGLNQVLMQQIIDKQEEAANEEAAANATIHWEYKTINIDASTLQTSLNEWGTDGWEVFSVIRLNSALSKENTDDDNDTTNNNDTAHVQVTAKRIAKVK